MCDVQYDVPALGQLLGTLCVGGKRGRWAAAAAHRPSLHCDACDVCVSSKDERASLTWKSWRRVFLYFFMFVPSLISYITPYWMYYDVLRNHIYRIYYTDILAQFKIRASSVLSFFYFLGRRLVSRFSVLYHILYYCCFAIDHNATDFWLSWAVM